MQVHNGKAEREHLNCWHAICHEETENGRNNDMGKGIQSVWPEPGRKSELAGRIYYCVKDFMFGVPMDENTKSEREFLTLVLNNIQEHIDLYEEEYEDELADF